MTTITLGTKQFELRTPLTAHVSNERRTVVTYRLAYLDRHVRLCADCVDNQHVLAECGSLGPVSHGAHAGICDGPSLVYKGHNFDGG